MSMLIIRHKVSDYGKWRPAFDSHTAMQKAAGLSNPRVLRSADDKSEIVWSVRGVGTGGFTAPTAPLDFGNSGTGCRLVMGAVAGCPITATFDGDASLRSRPMRRILDWN